MPQNRHRYVTPWALRLQTASLLLLLTTQSLHAVDVLNTNFRALNETVSEVIPEFEDLVADVEIEFRLAQRDPNGNCHPGINRIVSELTYVGDSEMKSLIQWPRNKYLNVWVCEYAAGAAGYPFPAIGEAAPVAAGCLRPGWRDPSLQPRRYQVCRNEDQRLSPRSCHREGIRLDRWWILFSQAFVCQGIQRF